jgi:hypothetical protein
LRNRINWLSGRHPIYWLIFVYHQGQRLQLFEQSGRFDLPIQMKSPIQQQYEALFDKM